LKYANEGAPNQQAGASASEAALRRDANHSAHPDDPLWRWAASRARAKSREAIAAAPGSRAGMQKNLKNM
jgi:hypothetical protein